MTEELKKCPLCNGESVPNGYGYTRCSNKECNLFGFWVSLKQWDARPIEDDLRRKLAEIEQNGCYTHDETGWMCEIAKENIELKRRLAELTEKQEDNWTHCPTCGCYVGHPYEEKGTGEPYEEKEKRMNECADVLLAGQDADDKKFTEEYKKKGK